MSSNKNAYPVQDFIKMKYMLFEQLEKSTEEIQFKEVIAFIDEYDDFTPTKFINGGTY